MTCIDFKKGKKGKRVVIEQEGECEVVTSHTPTIDGYIRIYAQGDPDAPRMELLHRRAWRLAHGKIPDGYEIDHICRNRRCVKLGHLQLLTRSEHKSKTNRERKGFRNWSK